MKKVLKWLLILVLALLLAAAAYVGYIYFSFSRIPDDQRLVVTAAGAGAMRAGETYTIATSNVGFGAYSADYSFFMDGGAYSRALSRDAVLKNTAGILGELKARDPDLVLLQEVDLDSDRSYAVNQQQLFADGFPDYAQTWAVAYDSAYLLYPPLNPTGRSRSCIQTLSRFEISAATRYSLPIAEGFAKLLDLDRCFSVQRIPAGDRELALINVHLSAYASDPRVIEDQLDKLLGAMAAERAAGNYVICGGDFNCDLTGESVRKFGFDSGDLSWARPFPADRLPEGFRVCADDATPSCRNADEPYQAGHTMVITVDGFIASDNVDVVSVKNMETGFAYSDHEPVVMAFRLG